MCDGPSLFLLLGPIQVHKILPEEICDATNIQNNHLVGANALLTSQMPAVAPHPAASARALWLAGGLQSLKNCTLNDFGFEKKKRQGRSQPVLWWASNRFAI